MRQQLKEKIKLQKSSTYEEKVRTIEFARALGFQCEAATFPVTSWEDGLEVPKDYADFRLAQPEVASVEIPEDYVAASDTAKPMPDFDWRQKKGLETMFAKGQLLKDQNLDQLPDQMDVHFVLSKDVDDSLFEAACNLAFRFGMEVTAYEGILTREQSGLGNEIVFVESDICKMEYKEKSDGVQITIEGKGQELVTFISNMCQQFPLQGPFDTWTDTLLEMASGMMMKNLDGQLAYIDASDDRDVTAYVDAEIETRKEELKRHFPDVTFVNYKGDKKVYEKEYHIPWEVDELKEVLETKVYNQIQGQDTVDIRIAVSEDKEVRAEIAKEIEMRLSQAGVKDIKVQVISSYKQGYSWIEEQEIPVLADKNVKKVDIAFKPFLPEGVTEWSDEDGAIPHYHNVGGDPNKWYDMPIRYLQELYPIEDAIVAKVGVDKDDVIFSVYEGNEDLTYELKAYDEKGEVIYTDTYKAAWSERPYLDAYPALGKVHPATGYIRVSVNGNELLDERVESDVEKIWDIYQREVLEDLRAYVDEKTEGMDLEAAQPFFSKLEIQVDVSEPNERLESREDLFSSLDGLHEDMYFAGTDFFKNYGMDKAGVIIEAPGLILPVIRKSMGKPVMRVILYGQEKEVPTIVGEKEIVPTLKKSDVNLYISQMEKTPEGIKAVIGAEGIPEEVVEAYGRLLEEGILNIGNRIAGINELELVTEKNAYHVTLPVREQMQEVVDIRDIDISEKELIGYERYIVIINQLKKVPQLNVFRTAVSYKGREIYGVELRPQAEGYISRTKRISAHPSEIINSRHHANEVSSTNSAFMLIKELLTNPAYKELPDKMNLVIVPMENVDGAAIHYQLQKDNPNWKLHVARFNSIGKEFYYEHFEQETIHTEAIGLRRLFMNLLPDFIIDNHGVPSHEWEQQFAGYTSPSYKGFWLPRSLLYGYYYHVTGDEYQSNYVLNKKMEDVIAEAFMTNEEITRENKMWARQFDKYAHSWLPKMFPANYYKNMINYWIPHEYDPAHRYPSIRYPWIVSVDYVSEVADETAQGDYLYSCAKAHLTHDLATLDMITKCSCVYDQEWSFTDSNIKAKLTRKRPVIAC